jgi:hypothetical protein
MYIISIAATLLTLAGLEISGWSFFPRNRRTGEGGEVGNQSPNSQVDK